jgi:hypothetical protein
LSKFASLTSLKQQLGWASIKLSRDDAATLIRSHHPHARTTRTLAPPARSQGEQQDMRDVVSVKVSARVEENEW